MGSFSIPMTRGLPYEIFMKQIIYEITERGHLYLLRQKWELPNPDCGEFHISGNPLSWQKLISVFIIVIIGISTALVILFIEKLTYLYLKNNVNPIKIIKVKEANKFELKLFVCNDLKLEEVKQIQNIMEHTQRLQENWEKFILDKSVKNNLNAADVLAKCRLFREDLLDLLATLPTAGSTHGTVIRDNVNERTIHKNK